MNRIVFVCFFTVRVIEHNMLFCLINMSFKYQYTLSEIVYNATFPLEWMKKPLTCWAIMCGRI